MKKNDINDRLSELGIYSDYYYRKELKPLVQLLNFDETLNCIFTGVYNGCRHMVAITDYRVIIIGAPTIGPLDVKAIRRSGVKEYAFNKKFLTSSVVIKTEETVFEFKQVQRSRYGLFNWAMEQPVKEFEK